MKRVYIGAPWWADYLAQALYELQCQVDRLTPGCFCNWADAVLDRWCRCETCRATAERREKYQEEFNQRVPGFCRFK